MIFTKHVSFKCIDEKYTDRYRSDILLFGWTNRITSYSNHLQPSLGGGVPVTSPCFVFPLEVTFLLYALVTFFPGKPSTGWRKYHSVLDHAKIESITNPTCTGVLTAQMKTNFIWNILVPQIRTCRIRIGFQQKSAKNSSIYLYRPKNQCISCFFSRKIALTHPFSPTKLSS